MAVGGVTAQAKAPRGTSDALFPYMPKARAEVQQDGFGKPDAFQTKASKGAVKMGAFKTLNPHVLSKSSESGYLNAPDGSTCFFSIDYKTSETNSIQGFKITVFDNLLQEVGSVEDEIQLGENETPVAQLSIGPDLTQKFFNYDNSYEIMIGVATNTTAYVNNYRTRVYSLGKNEPITTIDGYYCSAVNAARDAWSEDFYITFYTSVETETPEVNGIENHLDNRFVTYKKAGYSGMGDPVIDVRFPEICTTGADAIPVLSVVNDGKPWISFSHLKHCWYEDPYDYTNENPAADNEMIVDVYTTGSGWNAAMEKYSTTTFPLDASADDLFFLYHGNFQYDNDLNLTLSGDGTPSLYITKAHSTQGGDTFNYDYAVYSAAPKGETAVGVKKFDLAQGVSGGTFMTDIPGFAPQVMFIIPDGDGDVVFQFVNVNSGQVEHELDAYVSDEDPYLFNLDSDREYMALIKRKKASGEGVDEQLTIRSTDSSKAPLLEIGPEEGKGNLANIFIANPGSKSPKLIVTYMDMSDWKYTLQSYDLPLQLFENGDGTAENPYQISTIGGLKQLISAPAAHYAIGENGDNTWDKDNPDRFSQNAVMRFATFAQVRFFLEFRNQKYVTGSGPDTRRKATRSQSQSRTVYVPVDM